MAEAYETEEKKPDFQRYLDIARRRHMHFLIPLLFGWVLVWGLSWILPPRYKSTTLILVEEPTGPKAIDGADFGDSLQQRLQNMQQQILSRTRLLMIIDGMHLYGGGHKPLTDDEKVTKMRKEITIDLVRDAQNAGVTGFKIDYASDRGTRGTVHQRESAEHYSTVRRYNEVSGSTTRDRAHRLGRAGSQSECIQGCPRRSTAFAGSEQFADSGWTAGTTYQ
jgi:hypothetical protein